MTRHKQGFTIIEVVLVLAIAGLIFLMVFVALPALQRSQRDTARRNDMSRVDTALIQYQTNNQNKGHGSLPYSNMFSLWSACKDGSFDNGCQKQDGMIGNYTEKLAKDFVQRYMNSGTDTSKNEFKDPDGTYYNLVIFKNITETSNHIYTISSSSVSYTLAKDYNGRISIGEDFNQHIIYIFPGGQCDGEEIIRSTPSHFAVAYRLEGAGVYCIDDQ